MELTFEAEGVTRTDCVTMEEWIAERRKTIGASAVPNILGVGYRSPLQEYLLRRGELEWGDETEAMTIGKVIEPSIAKLYEMRTKREMFNPGDFAIFKNEAYPGMHATPDWFADFATDKPGVVELKNMNAMLRKEYEAEMPLRFLAQLQAQMACCGDLRRGSVAILFGNEHLHYMDYERDEEITEWIKKEVAEFLDRVERGIPPPAQGVDNAMLAKVFKRHTAGKIISLPPGLRGSLDRRKELKAVAKDAKAKIDEIEASIKQAMGDAEQGNFLDGSKVTWRTSERTGYIVEPGTTRRLGVTVKSPA